MHLDDPSAVLAQMVRVVRPGGRIVVAEPDWASIVIDSVDQQAMESLVRQANTVRRQPYIGRELNRRMAGVGLTDRRIETVPIFSLDYHELALYGMNLVKAADELAAEGRLDRQRAQLLIDAVEAGSREGTFCAYGGYFVARGMVPSSV